MFEPVTQFQLRCDRCRKIFMSTSGEMRFDAEDREVAMDVAEDVMGWWTASNLMGEHYCPGCHTTVRRAGMEEVVPLDLPEPHVFVADDRLGACGWTECRLPRQHELHIRRVETSHLQLIRSSR